MDWNGKNRVGWDGVWDGSDGVLMSLFRKTDFFFYILHVVVLARLHTHK